MRDKAGPGFVYCAFIEDDGDKRCSTGSSALSSALARKHVQVRAVRSWAAVCDRP